MQAHWEEAASLPQEQVGLAVRLENVLGGRAEGLLGLVPAVRAVLSSSGSCPARELIWGRAGVCNTETGRGVLEGVLPVSRNNRGSSGRCRDRAEGTAGGANARPSVPLGPRGSCGG